MKFKQLNCVAVGLFTMAAVLSANPIVVNDGKKLTNLVKIENALNSDGAEIDLTVVMSNQGSLPIGYLMMTQAGKETYPALCAAWHSDRYQPASVAYTVAAEVQSVGVDDVYDGVPGVIGWLNAESGVGISFVLNHYDGFQVGTVSFLVDDPEVNRALGGLFNLDGSPALPSTGSAWSSKGTYDASTFVTLKLAFAVPTEEDKAALEDVTARLTATALNSSTTIVEGTREIVLLTNLPVPEESRHRFGYFGYWDSVWDEGNDIGYYKNLNIDGELYNLPPTIEPIDDLAINENGTGEVILFIDDVESPSGLKVSVESSNSALVPVEGIEIGSTDSKQTLTVSPAANAFGESVITVTVSDGDKQASATFTLTVNYNSPPTIEPIDDLAINENGTGEVILFIDDVESPSGLKVSVESSNSALVPVEGIEIGSTDSKQTLTVSPAANAFGESVITVTVSDGDKQTSATFTLTVNEVNDPPVLSIVHGTDGGLTVEWSGGGVLQSSVDLKSWKAVENIASPFAVDPAEARKYFRVILE